MTGWRLISGWCSRDIHLLPALRECFTWEDDRATGWLYLPAQPVTPWPEPFKTLGPQLLDDLHAVLGVRFTAVAFQAYRNGAGVSWHYDRAWAAQAILSLGVTRMFGLRSHVQTHGFPLRHGDLLYMPPGFQNEWEHMVPTETNVQGERCSLVFRTPAP